MLLLESIHEPADLKRLTNDELVTLASELRQVIVSTVSSNGGHLGSNLGVIELTLALHRVFTSPRDIILWDTGHQAYVHKLVTGRYGEFSSLKQQGGLSCYPARADSEHDWTEQSHASTLPVGCSSNDHADHIKNLHESGYNTKNDFNTNGTIKTQERDVELSILPLASWSRKANPFSCCEIASRLHMSTADQRCPYESIPMPCPRMSLSHHAYLLSSANVRP